MIYYHGTNILIDKINLEKSRFRTDFGKGFYLTDKIGTAQAWAMNKTEIRGGIPAVLRYEINENLFTIKGKRFPNYPTVEWLEFICFNRKINKDKSNIEPRHDYNWISGLIADDDIADVVDDYLANDITINEAINRARALPQTYQLSLHTSEAVTYTDELHVFYKQFKIGRWTKDWLKT